MQRSGHTDLQGRSSYQPSAVQHPNGHWYLFAGLHNTIPVPNPACPAGTLPNPLNGNACEANGTMIIDVTDPVHRQLVWRGWAKTNLTGMQDPDRLNGLIKAVVTHTLANFSSKS